MARCYLISGRMDKDYLIISKNFANKITRVTIQDTMNQKHLSNSFKVY